MSLTKATYSMIDGAPVNVLDYGAVGDGVANDQPAFAAAVAAAASTNKKIWVPAGQYRFNAPLNITTRGLTIEGVSGEPFSRGGSEIVAYGCDAIVYGSDNGQPWTNPDYDGPQGQFLKKLQIRAGAPDTNLLCDPGDSSLQYAAGYKGVTDWRGGDIQLDDVTLSSFEYNFFGVQSDINHWGKILNRNSKYGIYAGPRSDQFRIDYLYSFFCDRTVTLDGCDGFSIGYVNTVASGGAAVDTFEVRRGTGTVWIEDVWVESFPGLGEKCRSFLGAGTVDGYAGNTSRVTIIQVDNVMYYSPASDPKTLGAIVALGKAQVRVGNIKAFRGSGLTNVDTLIVYPADQTTSNEDSFCILDGVGNGNFSAAKIINKLGSGAPRILTDSDFSGQQYFESTSPSGIVIRERDTAGTIDRRLQLSNGNLALTVQATRLDVDSAVDQQNRIFFRRSFQTATAMPTSGAWRSGDTVFADSASILGSPPNRYTLLGWRRVTTGSNHVLNTDWVEMRAPIE
jgi:hypothetical protein